MPTRGSVLLLVVAACSGPASTPLTPAESALALYEQAGILVTVRIEAGGVHCEPTIWGYYDAGFDVVTVCDPDHPRLVELLVHEIAHHLDARYLSEADRAMLLEDWGLPRWTGGGVWLERGAEWFAESVTSSLLPDAQVKVSAQGGLEVLLAAVG